MASDHSEYSKQELYEITQLARLKFLGEEDAKQVMTEDEWIIATMACLKYIDLELIVDDDDGRFDFNGKMGVVSKEGYIIPIYDYIHLFTEGIAMVRIANNYFHVDKIGNICEERPNKLF
jgi:hypothetical protein